LEFKAMTIVHYQPYTLMNRLHREIDQIFGDSFAAPAASGETSVAWVPSVDVHEEPERFLVHADLPGVDARDIHVTTEDGVLTLRGERRFEKRASDKGFERLERVSGSFLRRFTLPDNAMADQIRAKHVNGVLEITIPKRAAAEPKRVNVEVK
jgi:HSP20 family protein